MLINNAIPKEIIIACEKLYEGVHIYIKRIYSYKQYETDVENIRYIIFYIFYKHWDSLEDHDKKVIKKHYYGSHSLNKYVVKETHDDYMDRPINESPSKLLRKIAKENDFEGIDKVIRRVFKGYRLIGYYYNGGKSPIYKDEYGQSFCRLQLVRIGSKLDNDTIRLRGMIVSRKTGEVLHCSVRP